MRFCEAYCMIRRPVVVSPVNATLRIRLCDASGAPASIPKPLTMFTTPAGSRSPMSSNRNRIDAGVCSAGLMTTQLPAASAGASFQVAIRIGKFHGMICPTTPSGSWKWYATVFSSSWLIPPSCARSTPAKYRKWSTASGMSAARVSRTGLPFSQVSAIAMISRFSSIRSAILFRMLARSVGLVLPQLANACQATSTARSMSSLVPRPTSVNGLPLTGLTFSKYCPLTGSTNSPPM